MKKFKRKVLAMLMTNNFGSSLRQQLFDGAPFCSELLHTAIPQRAASGTTATFTRATTKTVENNDGYLVTLLAGEIGFPGARRVWNLLTYTEDFSNAAWTKENITVTADQAVAPDGTTTADKLTPSGTVAFSDILNSATVASGRTVALSIYAKKSTSNFIFLRLTMADFAPYTYFNLNTGAVGVTGAGITATITSVGDGWYRCCVIGIVSAAPPANRVDLGVSSVDGALNATAADSIYIWHPQLEDVTAQTTQTAGEYVSVGVPSDWAGDELVTNGTFDTDLSGWTLSASTPPTWNAGAMQMNSDGATFSIADQQLTTVVGGKYVLAFTMAQGSLLNVYAGTSQGDSSLLSAAPNVDGFFSYTFTATTTTTWIRFIDGAGLTNQLISNVVCKPAYCHGSFVDGVKCFPTDLAGNALTTMLGYSAEGARTNLCLQSNAFTTTWTASGTPAVTQNVVGPDGATSAWTLTDNDAGTNEGILQSITLTAATYTYSIFVKKTTGAQASYPMIYANNGATTIALCTIDTSNGIATVWTAYTGLTIATSSAVCVSYNASYWRVSLTFLGTAAAWNHLFIPAGTTNATQSTGVIDAAAQGSAVFYGAQVELGSFASSYIATTTAAATRNADVLTYPSVGNVSGSAGWAYFEVTADWSANSGASAIGLGTGSVAIVYMDGTNISFYDGVNADVEGAYVPSAGDKVCVTWGGTTSSIAVNGTVLASGTFTAFTPDATIAIGGRTTGLSQWGGNEKNVRIGQRQLSSSELGAITA